MGENQVKIHLNLELFLEGIDKRRKKKACEEACKGSLKSRRERMEVVMVINQSE